MESSSEPLPKVTFLPAQLTELVIKNWTGDIIDFEKNGQICKVYHGQGTCEFREGHIFKGEMKHGLLHGKGEFIWQDGTKYKGEFRENEITGNGRYDWTDGSFYEGQVINGLRHGKGTYTNPKEGVVYEGEWIAGLRHGSGTLKYRNGSVYDGNWEKGMKSGQGRMTYQSGNYYEGQWRINKRNGEGTMYWLSSNEKYTGNWEDNYQSGFGTHIWLEGANGDNKLLRNRYVGNWRLGLRYGNGTFYYSNGSKYEGMWRDNLKNGHGVFTFEDGTSYEGPFENDRMVNRNIQGLPAAQPAPKDNKEPATETTKKPAETGKSPDKNAKAPAATTAKLNANNLNATMNTTAGAGGNTTTGKFKANVAKREVEQNPFKTLLDISDLIEMEGPSATGGPKEIEKEVQNIMLRSNSDLKSWYKLYARKVEAQKSEESFSMTLRQVWRFLRDTQVIGSDCTIAEFDRVYNQGRKNHFSLAPKAQDQDKKNASFIQSITGRKVKLQQKVDSSDEEEDDDYTGGDSIQAEDVHLPAKVVLQRQFFEALVRAAAIKYSNRSDLPTLADKLEYLFKNKLTAFATKYKAKSIEEEKQFKVAEKIFDEYDGPLKEVFTHFAKSKSNETFKDITMPIEEVINMFKKAAIVRGSDGKPASAPLSIEDLISAVEKYFTPEQRLQNKLASQDLFQAYLDANPSLTPSKPPAPVEGEEESKEKADEIEALTLKYNEEVAVAKEKWHKQVLCEHLVYLRGVEIVYFEFREILLDLALNKLRHVLDPKNTGKVKPVLTKFLDEHFLKRLGALIRFSHAQAMLSQSQSQDNAKHATSNARAWPMSDKDKIIQQKLEEKRRQEEEERLRQEEFERQQAEMEEQRRLEEEARRAALTDEERRAEDEALGKHHSHHSHGHHGHHGHHSEGPEGASLDATQQEEVAEEENEEEGEEGVGSEEDEDY